jgi:hypothetical protein
VNFEGAAAERQGVIRTDEGGYLIDVSPLVFFGCYYLLIGVLILRSTFLPRILGALMALGGLGWLTFVEPMVAGSLSPYNMIPGILGEAALTVWLIVKGVDVPKWKAAAGVGEGRTDE